MSSDFRLIALYIDSFGLFKEQVLNFCSDYRTTFENTEEGLLLQVRHKKVLPEDFFALHEGNEGDGCVKSVAAIIGENGAGKTTIARLLCNLPTQDDRESEWKAVLIYEDNGEIKYYANFSPVWVEVVPALGAKKNLNPDGYFPSCKIFYFSPHFTTEQFLISTTGYHVPYVASDEGDAVKNISTTWLLLHPSANSELLSSVGMRQSSIFDADEKIRLFEFIAAYKEKCAENGNGADRLKEKFHIPMPKAISIGIHTEGFRLALDEIKSNAERLQIVRDSIKGQIAPTKLSAKIFSNLVDKYLQEVGDALTVFAEKATQYDIVTNVFMSFVARYIQESGIFTVGFPDTKLESGLLKRIKVFLDNEGWADRSKILECLKELPSGEFVHAQDDDTDIFRQRKMRELIEVLESLCDVSSPEVRLDGNIINCKLGNQKILELVCRLVQLHAQTRVISPYLKFDVIPHMSSGEMSFLTLFSRLYHFIKADKSTDKNCIIFIDEAETTLHPEWQRRLVLYCIRFLEVFKPGNNYQLVFASHSPMLLSDIPIGNTIFLKRRDADGQKHAVVYSAQAFALNQNNGATNTFAANIFDLYRSAFSMEDHGIVGMFAQEKLDNIMAKLNRIINGTENRIATEAQEAILPTAKMDDVDWGTLGLVGDSLAKQYFSSVKAVLNATPR